ncbi:GRAS family protein TF80-like [Prosopis cineraria]|uniref:GRAS family protein TF80-like n=1 Tax=Prosopis cineraria TaxID=364024 RepID=UPI00240EAC38|nr:GRAS family protein TF80-like [Prosopis cineraria]
MVSPQFVCERIGLEGEERGIFLIRRLATCARLIENGELKDAGFGLKDMAGFVSADGDPMQRLATYFKMALSYRLIKSIRHVPQVLCFTNPWSTLEQQHARKLFFEYLPFLKFAYLITNQAIVEAMQRESKFHIIVLNAWNAAQWSNLLHTLKEQRKGTNTLQLLKITGIHENKEVLQEMESQLIQEAKNLNIPFEFYSIARQLEELSIEDFPVHPEEPIAISSVLHLHSLLAVDNDHHQVSPNDSDLPLKLRRFLSVLWKLHPRLMIITEQESDNNGSSLTDRLDEALNFYAALFDGLEANNVLKERAMKRIMLERMLLGEEIKNIIACDGADRKERHGKFLKTWRPSLELAEFIRVPIDYEKMLEVTKPLVQSYGPAYKLLENNQCLFTCWKNRPLYSISAWRF